MNKNKKLRFIFWMTIFSLFFLPVVNSFVVNLNNVVKLLIANTQYADILYNLNNENKNIKSNIEYYKTSEGLKSLVKGRLHKVEKGEILIEFDGKGKNEN